MESQPRKTIFRPVNPALAAAIAEFKALKYQEAGKVMVRLFDALINDFRVENDTVELQNLPRNQGRIDVLLKLKDLLEREQTPR
jgi:hypothetical protein